MLVMVAAALLVLAVGLLLQARSALVVGNYRRFALWSTIALPSIVLSVGLISVLVSEPRLLWWVPPAGFGVDWRCQENVPPAVRICFRN